MNKILVAPSILSGDFANMGKTVSDLKMWGADYAHVDVMDGVYVTNLTFGMPMVKALRRVTDMVLDVHLMITKPERYVEEFVKSGADIVTFHPDASDDPGATLKKIKAAGAKCGIVFNPDIDIDKYAHLFEMCDMILIMSVFAGYGGQKFIDYCLDRLKKVKAILDEKGLDIPIEIDGGITEENVNAAIDAGATVIVAGSAVFKSEDPARTIEILRGTK
ncbi:MAG TPA: ribulose-phosphate 3-epimerase [Clostridia bacterium]|jgi:ribulose-phosphate 3-epimerase|nr:ribulose-phosphate 3-epimerase [Clostridia bacterium]